MTILLVVIYIAFIGLEIPDSLIGAAWPAIYTEMNMPVEAVSAITMLVSGCTVLSSLFSFGTAAEQIQPQYIILRRFFHVF